MLIIYSILIVTCTIIYAVYRRNTSLIVSLGSWNMHVDGRKIAFFVTFFLLAFLSAIRDDIGCDYGSYMMHIRNIQAGLPNYMEIGFKWSCLQLAKIDSNPRFVIIVFGVLTVYLYLKAIWDQSDDVLFSVFVFLSWGYYFLTYNTIRNYFALALVLYSIKFLNNRKYIIFIALVVIAALFHKSAIVCIPMYFLAKRRYKQKHVFLFIAITIVAILFKDQLRSIVFILYPGYLDSAYDTGRISLLNIIKAISVIVLCLSYYRRIEDDDLTIFYMNLNIFALMYYIGLYWTPEVSRIGFYLNASTILLIPRVVNTVNTSNNKYLLRGIIIAASLVLFTLLGIEFYSSTMRLLPYKTWLNSGY